MNTKKVCRNDFAQYHVDGSIRRNAGCSIYVFKKTSVSKFALINNLPSLNRMNMMEINPLDNHKLILDISGNYAIAFSFI
ncbi:MAG: hypothetical protein KA444_10060 [Bacteroidia bacterium]|nr:hypothetical protein [Bacteroidia bacterium]